MALMTWLLLALAGPQDEAAVEAEIRTLGSENPEERDAASKALLGRGPRIRPRLQRASLQADPETAGRALDLLAALDRHIDSLGYVLEKIWREDGVSLNVRLRRSACAVHDTFRDRPWKDIAASLETQGIVLVRKNDLQGGMTLDYLARKDAYVSPAGVRHDLRIEIQTALRPSKTEATSIVWRRALPSLHFTERVDVAALAAKPYPAGTVFQRFFEEDEVKKVAAAYPVLEELEVSYGLIVDRWEDANPQGFQVHAKFTNREHSAGKSMFRTAASGLDPRQTHDGLKEARFEPKDTLGHFRNLGGSEWTSATEPRRFHTLRSAAGRPPRPASFFDKASVVRGAGDLKGLAEGSTALAIQGDGFSDEDCEGLARFAKLRALGTFDASIGAAGLGWIVRLPELERLDFSSHEVDDEGLRRIAGIAKLKSLSLPWSSNLTDAGVESLAGLKGLRELHLHWSRGLTDAGVRHIAGLSGLTSLRLWGAGKIGDAGLAEIGKLEALEELTLSHSQNWTAAGMAPLAKLRSLRELTLGYASVDNGGLAVLALIPSLEVVWLRGLDGITDAGLLQLKALPRLQYLHVYGSNQITNDGLKALQAALPGRYLLE